MRRRIERGLAAMPETADARQALLSSLVGAPTAELESVLARPATAAAVLVGLIARDSGPVILLTERAAHLPHHPGQISFPGGRIESTAESATAAALREAHEEVGLEPNRVSVLGQLPPRLTGTGFAVTPIVGWVDPRFEPVPDPSEVESVFEVPVGHLLDAVNARQTIRERFGSRFRMVEYRFERHRIWGATAAILYEVLKVLDE